MALEVIGAGFGRTGTLSLKKALEKLGYKKCYHMMEVLKNRDFDLWGKKADGEAIPWEEVFDGYRATLDWPTTRYYKELADYYPDAKVILTVRDPVKWHTSVMNTIYQAHDMLPEWIPRIRKFNNMVDKIVWRGVFDGKVEDHDHSIAVFNRHIDEVKREIPAERLLVYQVSEGWEPLCAFLGVPVPEGVDFPRTNTSSSFDKGKILLKALRFLPYLLLALGVAFLLRALLG